MMWYSVIVALDLHVVAVLGAALYTTTTTGSPITTENVKFVQKLKADLRRNNDDYILGRKLPETVAPKVSSEHSSAYIDDIEEVYRRALVERGTQHLKVRNKNNIGQDNRPVYSADNMIKETNKKIPDVKDGKQYLRAMDMSREKDFIPSPNQIDMSPARGGRIDILRAKNRLCQRHVLIPEGPKYDSQGRVYLRAHPPNAARPYAHTRSPRLLLPRCCNCCKKSVLGCE